MQTNNKILDDIAKVASGAMGAAFSARDEMRARLRAELERVFNRMDLVSRDEFDAVKAMAARARLEQEQLTDTVAKLEARLADLEAGASSPGASSPGASSPGAVSAKPARTAKAKAGGAEKPAAPAKPRSRVASPRKASAGDAGKSGGADKTGGKAGDKTGGASESTAGQD